MIIEIEATHFVIDTGNPTLPMYDMKPDARDEFDCGCGLNAVCWYDGYPCCEVCMQLIEDAWAKHQEVSLLPEWCQEWAWDMIQSMSKGRLEDLLEMREDELREADINEEETLEEWVEAIREAIKRRPPDCGK